MSPTVLWLVLVIICSVLLALYVQKRLGRQKQEYNDWNQEHELGMAHVKENLAELLGIAGTANEPDLDGAVMRLLMDSPHKSGHLAGLNAQLVLQWLEEAQLLAKRADSSGAQDMLDRACDQLERLRIHLDCIDVPQN